MKMGRALFDSKIMSVSAAISEADVLITAISWGLWELQRHKELNDSAGIVGRMAELAGDIETLTTIQARILLRAKDELAELSAAASTLGERLAVKAA